MDREPEELQFLGFFGIYREAYKIISSWWTIFTKITLSLILPLSFIFLAHIQISEFLFAKILRNEDSLDTTPVDSPRYNVILDRLSSEWTTYWLFKAAYFVFVLIFSLLSTSAVVYTVACVYTAKEITFRKIMSVVPKVWKRLMVTFLWNFIIVFAYNVVALLIFILTSIAVGPGAARTVVLLVFLAVYLVGLVYITVVWHLASVVSVLEDSYGIQAMIKSKALIKGKMWVASAFILLFNLAYLLIQIVFEKLVVHGWSMGVASRVGYGIVCVMLLFFLDLLGLVVQTVIYFVCKSYHHENIDQSCLADHLEVYLGEYVPFKGKDVQLEQYYV
ncbi:PREDICTED: uncharacterized protein LOC104602788 [Nelumbo nucifera]|uniref:Polyadenylate-binding protein 1-B-binding protein n=2 Tax=Nelumbo nucifera TaxID=4432 RepID=A0A822YQZ4_NELNU|nr:PREDICTED: uncharacterized protein LOC104602788 [Nelumbo nucifera]DAD33991.1 TPA_asm: hypothetical protein HUJ06_004631 [Nelumbo nucifera]DAD34738.1 TPA_asm: hypothetical protein HUJ06_005378 [Nelumbo nucifera]